MEPSAGGQQKYQSYDKQLLPARDAIKRLAISESGFVFDPQTGHSFTLNETGREILYRLQKGLRFEAILKELVSDYEVAERDAERDILEFLGSLREHVGN